jgi:ABC-type nitrate/sulfonate/bicarbonate transport system permease component
MASNGYAYGALRTLVEFLRPVPSVALIPVAILLFGVGYESKIFLVAFASIWPLLIQTLSGLRDVDPAALTTAAVYRIPRTDRVLRVLVPSALPYVATGLRIASTTGLIVALVAELIIGAPGLGQAITLAQAGNAVTLMYALIISAGLLGLGLNFVLLRLERAVLHWHPSQREVTM